MKEGSAFVRMAVLAASITWIALGCTSKSPETPSADRRALSTQEFQKEFDSVAGEWKDALKDYVFQRQYPYDSIPEGAYQRAAAHRDQLAAARIASASGSMAPNSSWEFMGPRNMDAPYRRYWGPNPVNGRVSAVAYDPNNTTTVFAGSGFGGLMRSTNGGTTWSVLSDDWEMTHVSSIAIDPGNSQNVYVGTGDYQTTGAGSGLGYGIGIMKSTDGGSTWRNVGRAQMVGEAVSSLIVHPDASNVLIAATGRGRSWPGRVFVSEDFGESWATMTVGGVIQQNDFSSVSVSLPRGNGTRNVYAVGGRPGSFASALYRSRDQGRNWTSIALPAGFTGNPYVVASETAADRVYVMDSSTAGSVWRSENAGGNWVNITGDFPNGPAWANGADYPLGARVIRNGRVYACIQSGGSGANAPTGAASNNTWWQWITNFPGFDQVSYNFYLGCMRATIGGNPQDVLVLGQVDLFLCGNPTAAAPNWVSVGQTTVAGPAATSLTGSPARTHSDQHAFGLNPVNRNQALIGNDGGVYRVTYSVANNDLNFANLNADLEFTQFYDASWHPNQGDQAIGATQDNAFPNSIGAARPGDLNNWQNYGLGDGLGVEVNPNNPNVQYITNQFGSVYQTTDNWQTWNRDTLPGQIRASGANNAFREPISYQAATNQLYHANFSWIDRYSPATGIWTSFLRQTRDTRQWQVISFAPSDATRIYAGSVTGELTVSTDSGASFTSWDDQAPPLTSLPNRAITDIDVHPTNPNRFLVAFSGFEGPGDVGHLFRVTMTPINNTFLVSFANVSGSGATGLPDVPINTVEHDPRDPQNTWYVGTDVGVFMTNDGGATWFNATGPLGLPNVQVNDLEYVPGTGYLNAATWGRGMWRIRLGGPNLIEVSVAPNDVNGGQTSTGTVTLFDPAPPNQLTIITLESSRPLSAVVPASVIVPVGERTKTFTIDTWGDDFVRDVTIAARRGILEKSTTLRVRPAPIESLEIDPSSVLGGGNATGTVRFDGLVHEATTLTVSSSHPSVVNVPATVNVPEGASMVTFPIQTDAVAANTNVTVTATYRGSSRQDTLTVQAGLLTSYTVSQSPVTGGATVQGTVTMTSYAPAGGKVVNLSSTHPALVSHPASVTIPAGQSSTTFDIETFGVQSTTDVTLTAVSGGITRQANLRLNPVEILDLYLSPDFVPSGRAFQGYVFLTGPAPAGGQPVTLSRSRPLVDIPEEVVVPAGSTSAGFEGTAFPVKVDEVLDITAKVGASSKTKSLTIWAPRLIRFTFDPNQVIGGNSVTGTVEFDGIAAVDTPVSIENPSPTLIVSPTSIVIPEGSDTGSAEFGTKYTDLLRDLTVIAKHNGLEASDVLQLRPARVSGKLVFEDLSGLATTLNPITLQLRNEGTTTVFKEILVNIDADTVYTFDSPVAGRYDVAVKHLNWLRGIRTVVVGVSDLGAQNVLLNNGDLNGDNTVNVVDFLALRQAFGSAPGAGNWNPMADLNKDGFVSVADFLILRKNFGRTGAG